MFALKEGSRPRVVEERVARCLLCLKVIFVVVRGQMALRAKYTIKNFLLAGSYNVDGVAR